MRTRARSAAPLYIFLVLLLAVIAFPLFWMVSSSFKPGPELFTRPPRLLPENATIAWYSEVLFRTRAPRMFFNSFIIATATMLLNMVIATLAAYSVSRFRYRGRSIVMFSSLSAYIFPPIVLLVPLFLIVNNLGLVDTRIGAVIPHTLLTLPFSLWLLRAFFDGIPRELDEAALVDGATHFGAFRRIVLPLAAPGVFSTGLLAFIISWSEFLFSSVILTSTANKTLPVGIAEFITAFDVRWGEIMALGTITTVPILIFFALIQRYFVAGILAGGLKG